MTLRLMLIEASELIRTKSRIPEFWIIILLPMFYASLSILTGVVMPSLFPAGDMGQSILKATNGTLNAIEFVKPKFPCIANGVRVFGYKFSANMIVDEKPIRHADGIMCWDLFKRRWEWEFNTTEFSRFNSKSARE